jgi:SAM-dependent methyltransferase
VTSSPREPKARFTDRVEDYIRYRPGYPVEVVRTLERELGIVPRKTRVVDVGSGTGISARLFLEEGYDVIGVEPNAAMRAAGEALLASWPRFRSIEGSAEATTLPDECADLVVSAQAFHWFNLPLARFEMLRILDRAGAVALMWNDRKVETTPFLRGYDQAIRNWSIDYVKVNHQNLSEAEVTSFFGPGGCQIRTFSQHQDFDWDGLLGRALSSSYVPLRGQPGHDELVAALRGLFDEHEEGGKVRFEYDTTLYFGPLG